MPAPLGPAKSALEYIADLSTVFPDLDDHELASAYGVHTKSYVDVGSITFKIVEYTYRYKSAQTGIEYAKVVWGMEVK